MSEDFWIAMKDLLFTLRHSHRNPLLRRKSKFSTKTSLKI
jgi:hypothetical protein